MFTIALSAVLISSTNLRGHQSNAATLRLVKYQPSFSTLFTNTGEASSSSSSSAVGHALATRDFAFAHEGPVYLPSTNEVFFTSNRFSGNTTNPAKDADGMDQSVRMYAVGLDGRIKGVVREISRVGAPDGVMMANGATSDCITRKTSNSSNPDAILVISQGIGPDRSSNLEHSPSQVMRLNPHNGVATTVVGSESYLGLPFSSLNDVVQTADGTVFFTDPWYGRQQGFRLPAYDGTKESIPLPDGIWALSPGANAPRMVSQGMSRPNGLALSEDGKTLYSSASGYALGDGTSRYIVAFDVVPTIPGGSVLTLVSERMFYQGMSGIPDGIKVDVDGNVYTGEQGGITVIAKTGIVLGRIELPDSTASVTQVVFAGEDFRTLVVLSETTIWTIEMEVAGALQC